MRRNWFVAAVVLGIVAIVVAAVVMRATEDEPQSAAEWADSVCTSLGDWRESISGLADVSGEPLTADTLRDRLDEADSATTQLITDLRDLGAPDLEAGDDVEEDLNDAAAELESRFEDLRESAEAAADAPASEFLSQLAALASDFAALQTAIGTVVTTLQNADVAEEAKAELDQAFSSAPSCQALESES